MARLAEVARLKLDGLPKDVDQNSPLPEQVHFIYLAMHQYAQKNNWADAKRGGRAGRQGQFTMRYLIEQLFPEASREERQAIQQIAGAVLRQTGAAACVNTPSPSDLANGIKPTWYVANDLPDNLLTVAGNQHGGGGSRSRLDETERKLTPREAGEDREPAPVEVRSANGGEDLVVSDQFVEEIYEQIATCPVPVTIPELSTLSEKPQWAVRHATEKLLADGRVEWRTETRAEKAVRGGGELPPARPSRLFWPSPGPVPERKVLPPGIDPVKSSRVHAIERLRQQTEDDLTIYEHLKPGEKRRTSGVIAEALDMPVDRVKASLARMFGAGKLRRNETSRQYFWADVPPRPQRQQPAPPVPPKEEPAAAAKLTTLERVYELIDELGREAGYEIEVDDGSSEDRIAELEAENAELKRQLEKIRSLLG